MDNKNLIENPKGIIINNVYWDDIQGKPGEYTPEYHTHSEYAKRYHKHNVSDIMDIDDFATSGHIHDDRYYTKEEVAAIVNSIDTSCEVHWDDIIGLPEKFPSMDHTHNDDYYTKSEIDAKLRRYALLDHRHTVDDIDGDFIIPGEGDNTGGSGENTSDIYTKFIIRSENFFEGEYGLYCHHIEHDFGTQYLDVIAKDLEGAFVLVDINCLDDNNIVLTAMYNDPIVLLAKRIAVE